ncbi:unnamed protein product [Paramecium sonneborni]|uniref:Uncharacterized protein n=1 Tax=Paramecium sonneborni TaxID=65129 RepID=A0A8S1P0B2_9CILI|nr:unnamed protein product [Paramecium sonneborni]
MQAIPSHALNQLILNGDQSPAQEENSPHQLPQSIRLKQIQYIEMPKNRIKQKKRSIQEITDELLQWKYFLDHKFQHHD